MAEDGGSLPSLEDFFSFDGKFHFLGITSLFFFIIIILLKCN